MIAKTQNTKIFLFSKNIFDVLQLNYLKGFLVNSFWSWSLTHFRTWNSSIVKDHLALRVVKFPCEVLAHKHFKLEALPLLTGRVCFTRRALSQWHCMICPTCSPKQNMVDQGKLFFQRHKARGYREAHSGFFSSIGKTTVRACADGQSGTILYQGRAG